MTDNSVDASRSAIMRAVPRANTGPEMKVRRALHALGYRFRLHRKDLPGSPDIVLPKHRTVVFVHGCFWHRHPGCRKATIPKTRQEFWGRKFERNVERDREAISALEAANWRSIVIWECAVNAGGYEKRLVSEIESDASANPS